MSDGECDHEKGHQVGDGVNGDAVETDGGRPSIGEVLDCLTNSRRRTILYYLQENEVVDEDKLVTEIATQEAKIPPDEVSTDQRERIKTQLVHNHLPKLADAQCIEYDHRSGTVRYTQPAALLDKALRLLRQFEEEYRE